MKTKRKVKVTLGVRIELSDSPYLFEERYPLPRFIEEYRKKKKWDSQHGFPIRRVVILKYINGSDLQEFFGENYDGPRIYFLDSHWDTTEHFYIKDILIL